MGKLSLVLVFIFILLLPFVIAEENNSLTSFFQEKIENNSGAPIIEDTSQTIWTFEEVMTYVIYFVVGLFLLVGLWMVYHVVRKRRIKDVGKRHQ